MTYVIIVVILIVLIFSVSYAKKVDADKNSISGIDTTIDSPISFGFKCMWFAVKTDNTSRVAEILKIESPQPSNWKSGFEYAFKKSVFVSPPIDGWTLAIGWGLPPGDSPESIAEVKEILNQLSQEFNESQFFCTHRVVEYHCWIRSENGQITRTYSYYGENGENIEVFGPPTNIESEFDLVNSFSPESENEEYWEREGLVYPDEDLVIEIAKNWSVDPTTLDDRKDITKLGILGNRRKN